MSAQKFLLIYRTPAGSEQSGPPSPAELEAMMATWNGWKAKFKQQVVDLGDGLKPGGRQLKGGVVTDGAFIESKEVVGGYSIIAAANYDEALTVARGCPIASMPGGSIEIRELAGF
jgi:hypothetical protein